MGFFWEMVTVAVVMGTAIPLSVIWIKHREKLAGIESENRGDRVDKLEQRMMVLERIVTDKGYSVAEEIKALGHETAVDVPVSERERA